MLGDESHVAFPVLRLPMWEDGEDILSKNKLAEASDCWTIRLFMPVS